MTLKELVGTVCEAVDRHSGNFQPVTFHSHACQTRTEVTGRGGIVCQVHLTPDGEISENQTGCVCSFTVRPKASDAKAAKG